MRWQIGPIGFVINCHWNVTFQEKATVPMCFRGLAHPLSGQAGRAHFDSCQIEWAQVMRIFTVNVDLYDFWVQFWRVWRSPKGPIWDLGSGPLKSTCCNLQHLVSIFWMPMVWFVSVSVESLGNVLKPARCWDQLVGPVQSWFNNFFKKIIYINIYVQNKICNGLI